ncbi:MAG TPA: hypothetical protein ENI05_06225 [Porticoccus sp.]|nr:hypothetical protein [Porticoccus sp.]
MSEEISDREIELAEEMMALQHAMQTGIKALIEYGLVSEDPKHLRTGMSSALVFNGTVVRLLVEKGIITREEYAEAAVVDLKAEVKRYEKEISEHLGGANITLK